MGNDAVCTATCLGLVAVGLLSVGCGETKKADLADDASLRRIVSAVPTNDRRVIEMYVQLDADEESVRLLTQKKGGATLVGLRAGRPKDADRPLVSVEHRVCARLTREEAARRLINARTGRKLLTSKSARETAGFGKATHPCPVARRG